MATPPSETPSTTLYDLGYDIETLCDDLKNYPKGSVHEYFEHEYKGDTYVISVKRK